MARSRVTVKRWQKAAKVKALADNAGTPGEQQAAEAALERIGATPDDIALGKLVTAAEKQQMTDAAETRPTAKPVAKAPARTQREPFTDAVVKKLPTPETASKIYYDGTVPGFGARVTAGGSRAYILNYKVRGTGRERRYTIGDCANWTIGQARKKARDLRHEIDDGADPLGDLQDERAAPTVAALIDRFTAEHVEPRLRPGTQRGYKTLLTRHVRPHFGAHARVADVSYEDIDALHRKITKSGTPYAANRTIAVLSKMFSLAIRWKMRTDNPAKGIERNYEPERERYLDGDELVRLATALAAYPDQQVANIIRVLLMTGARVGEVMAMKWADVSQTDERDPDGNVVHKTIWTKVASTTKQEKKHVVPLSAPVAQLLEAIGTAQTGGKNRPLGTFVFPGPGNAGHTVSVERAWKTICATAAIKDDEKGKLRVHDLRHSFASELASSGASLALIGKLLGHSNPKTTARYAHFYQDPQRAAVERVGARVTAAGKPAEEPIPFPKGGGRGR